MIFNIFIAIVFIAELVIAFAIIIHLIKLDKYIIKYDTLITEIRPKIADIMQLTRKISEQSIELSNLLIDRIKVMFKSFWMEQLKNILAGLTFWAVKTEVEKHS